MKGCCLVWFDHNPISSNQLLFWLLFSLDFLFTRQQPTFQAHIRRATTITDPHIPAGCATTIQISKPVSPRGCARLPRRTQKFCLQPGNPTVAIVHLLVASSNPSEHEEANATRSPPVWPLGELSSRLQQNRQQGQFTLLGKYAWRAHV